jgi:hypothetical protein
MPRIPHRHGRITSGRVHLYFRYSSSSLSSFLFLRLSSLSCLILDFVLPRRIRSVEEMEFWSEIHRCLQVAKEWCEDEHKLFAERFRQNRENYIELRKSTQTHGRSKIERRIIKSLKQDYIAIVRISLSLFLSLSFSFSLCFFLSLSLFLSFFLFLLSTSLLIFFFLQRTKCKPMWCSTRRDSVRL